MRHVAALTISLALLAAPATAETEVDEGLNLLQEGAKLLFRGLADEMEPAFRDFADNLEPAMRKLLELIDDFDAYHAPERLPNGDIIIRRKTPLVPGDPFEGPGDIEI